MNMAAESELRVRFRTSKTGVKKKKGKRKVQGMPQSQIAALPRHQEEEERDKNQKSPN